MNSAEPSPPPRKTQHLPDETLKPLQKGPLGYALAGATIAAMTGIIQATHADASLVNIPPLYLLAVQAVAVLVGSRAAVFASVLAFLAFDWFFVEPKYQFTVRDPFEFVALCVFLVTAILVGQLTGLFQARARQARKRELTTAALARASWTVAADINRDSALNKVLAQLSFVDAVSQAVVYLRGKDNGYTIASSFATPLAAEPMPVGHDGLVRRVFHTGESEGWHSQKFDRAQHAFLPVVVDEQVVAVMYLQLRADGQMLPEDRQVVDSLVSLIAVVMQRDKLIEAQTRAQALTEADRLKTALLQMVSHDFRSPLASIKASASSLKVAEHKPIDEITQTEILETIEHEADRLNRMVGNILDLSRLESDAWKPIRDQIAGAELVGSTLDAFNQSDNKRIHLEIEPGIELYVDFTQMVQVLKNLIENALKYSDTPVELLMHHAGQAVNISILDRGPGLPANDREHIFEALNRASEHQESAMPGLGVGLAICRGLVEANGGTLTANNREGGGAAFYITLPDKHNDLIQGATSESSRN